MEQSLYDDVIKMFENFIIVNKKKTNEGDDGLFHSLNDFNNTNCFAEPGNFERFYNSDVYAKIINEITHKILDDNEVIPYVIQNTLNKINLSLVYNNSPYRIIAYDKRYTSDKDWDTTVNNKYGSYATILVDEKDLKKTIN